LKCTDSVVINSSTVRISVEGPPIILSPKFALTMTLIVHELATNAAKYGALSRPAGKLSVHWSLADRVLNLIWREAGGPPIESPSHHGLVMVAQPNLNAEPFCCPDRSFKPSAGVLLRGRPPMPVWRDWPD
jgi:two-component sensor histidine kinase